MQTTQHPAADLQAAVKKALHSASFTKFMSQAVHAALTEVKDQSTGIVLTPSPYAGIHFSDSSIACSYEVHSADHKSCVRMQRNFENTDYPEYRHHWYGSERHTDALGRVWSTQFPHMVQDDFGVLIKVPE